MIRPTATQPSLSRLALSLLALSAALAGAAALASPATAANPEHHYLPGLSHVFAFGGTCEVATDDEGYLYVADRGEGTVAVFSPQGQPVTEFETSGAAESPCGLAVDSTGAVWVNGTEAGVVEYVPSAYPPASDTTYEAEEPLVEEEATDVAVDPTTDDVYVAEGEHISSYTSAGVLISGTIGEGLANGEALFDSVDVYGQNHFVYASTEPIEESGANAVQKLEITGADAGTYNLSFRGQASGWAGAGSVTQGSPVITGVSTTSGQPTQGLEVSGTGIEPGSTIEEYDPESGQIELSQPATGTGSGSLTGSLGYVAPGRAIRGALEALSTVGAKNLKVSCEHEEGEIPAAIECEITFTNALGNTDLEEIVPDSHLTGSAPEITVITEVEGAPEPGGVYVFNAAGTAIEGFTDGTGSTAGAFSEKRAPSIGVDQATGNVLVTDVRYHGVVDEFDPEGDFLSQVGPTFGNSQRFKEAQSPFVNLEGFAYGVTVDRSSGSEPGNVYVSGGGSVNAFGPAVSGVTLTLEKGTHGGTVESTPAGILCNDACSQQGAEFTEGETVVLKAPEVLGSRFVEWESGCDEVLGTGSECKVEMDAAKTVKAVFARQFLLTVLPTGAGSGTVTSSLAGIDCGVACEEEFDEGTVTLTAAAASGSRFTGWATGNCQEVLGAGGEQCKVSLSAAKVIEPKFIRAYGLTVEAAGAGLGAVTSSPTGIDCGSTCAADFNEGATLTLTATPASGSLFSGWEVGDCDEVLGAGGKECKVQMSAAKTVKALFARQEFALTVSRAGAGSGTIGSAPVGIDCGSTCSHAFAVGTVVTLTASAASGSHFTGWSGGGCSGTGSCVVTVDAAMTVTATFTADSPPPGDNPPPPPAPEEGRSRFGALAPVSGGKAAVEVACKGSGGCAGTLKLTTRIKGKTLVLGKVRYRLGAGESRTIKVKLSGRAKRLLKQGDCKVKVSGGGVTGTITLKPGA